MLKKKPLRLLVVGSVALDTVKTPFGNVQEALGGSATYFSVAASYFTRVNLVAVIGEDFPSDYLSVLIQHNIDLDGLERAAGPTFRWKGEYGYQLNEAKTLETHLNVFEKFRPKLPESYRESDLVFLANIDPELQEEVLHQVRKPKWVVCDTMNFWIEKKREALLKTLKQVNILIINDGEARQLAEEPNLVKAARRILDWGPQTLIVKRGEYGAVTFNGKRIFTSPAYPLETVFDPTGAGDSFAGGFMGYLARTGDFKDPGIRQAVIYGSVMASFNVESFSLDRLRELSPKAINARYKEFKRLTHFEGI
jgi:sugar/nucleoside kinase (ribokinase family)